VFLGYNYRIMLKRLRLKYLPMAILFILIVAVLCMSRYAEDRKAKHQENANQVNSVTLTPGKTNDGTEKTDETEDSPSWVGTFTWPEGVTAWALLLTLFVIAWQSTETRDAAKSALLNAQVVINAERPYLVISVESPSPNQFVFTAKNEGRTPARINSIWTKPLMADQGGTLRIPSDEETAESLISTPPRLLPPNGTCTVFYCDEQRLRLMRESAFSAVYFYGRISYFNTLEAGQIRPYETKWLYCQLPVEGKRSIPFLDPRHPEHNTWT
jgi:hypothetical protein